MLRLTRGKTVPINPLAAPVLFYFGCKGYIVGLITFGSVPLMISYYDSDATTLQLCGILVSCPWMTKVMNLDVLPIHLPPLY